MKKIYIAGCGGMLGAAFFDVFGNDYELKCTDKDPNESWLQFLDFRSLDAYQKDVTEFQPDYLFHLGAYTDLDFCEANDDDTHMTNAIAVENATYIANRLDIPLLYISTAGIFDGVKESYDDWDRPNPLGVYARSKYIGELAVTASVRRHLVCRAGWMMGGGPTKDKKFIKKMMLQIRERKKELFVVNDKLGTPTYTRDFAQNIRLLLEKEYWGLYNMVSGGLTSRLEVCTEMLRVLGLTDKIAVKEVGSEYFAKEYFAARPPSERLVNRKLNLRNVNHMRHWKTALEEYLRTEYSNYL